MFKLSKRSIERSDGVDSRLIEIRDRAIEITVIDFGIPKHGGLRTSVVQNHLFRQGKSKADGYEIHGKHQSGKALDFYAYIDGKASWQPKHLAMVACAFLQAASELGYSLESGVLWSSNKLTDGIPYGWDMAHVQLID